MIPPVQLQAAHRAGILAAKGLIDAHELLPDLVAAARLAAPALDPSGLRTRLAHVLADSQTAHHAAFDRAGRAVNRAVADALATRRPREIVLAAAAAADPGDLLGAEAREAIILAALARALRGLR